MKKNYLAPATEQHRIQLSPLLVDSIPMDGTGEASTETNGDGEEEYSNSLSRRDNVWDD